MNVYENSLLRLGEVTFGENAEGRLGDFGKRDLISHIAAGFRQIGVFLAETSGWNQRAAMRKIREIGRDLDDSLYQLGTTVYSAYFRGEIDNPTIQEECRVFSPTPSRSEWLREMGFTPICIDPEPEDVSYESDLAKAS
jgi:hypothetical protein